MTENPTVLGDRVGGDSFAVAVQGRIDSEVLKARGSIGDSPFLERHESALRELARYAGSRPMHDPLLALLWHLEGAVGRDTDHWNPSGGKLATFYDCLGITGPPPSAQAAFEEMVAIVTRDSIRIIKSNAAKIVPDKEKALVGQRDELSEQVTELEAELAKRDEKIEADSQELSDLRGEVKRNAPDGANAAQVEVLQRRCAELEGALDESNRQLAAAERKTRKRAKATA